MVNSLWLQKETFNSTDITVIDERRVVRRYVKRVGCESPEQNGPAANPSYIVALMEGPENVETGCSVKGTCLGTLGNNSAWELKVAPYDGEFINRTGNIDVSDETPLFSSGLGPSVGE
jgi:hypothetical protein